MSQKKKFTIALVAGTIHEEITDAMVHTAKKVLQEKECTLGPVVFVPGSYELPLIVQELMRDSSIDGVVALGAIEKGETLDGEVMGHVVNQTLMNLMLTHGKPIGMGIIGPGATPKQMHERKVRKAEAASRAVITILMQKDGA